MDFNLKTLRDILCRYHRVLGLLETLCSEQGQVPGWLRAEYLRVSGFVGEAERLEGKYGTVVRIEKKRS